jgi:hypothetical protein
MEPMKHTRLKRRGAVYYFRCKIPADLVEHYSKREILESLHTKDPKEALRKVRSRSLQQEEEFDRVRAGRGVAELTEELLETLSKKWVAGVLAEDESNRVGGWMKQQHVFDEDVWSLQQIEAGLREALARGDFALVEASADEVLQESGIKLDKGSESYRRLCFRILKAGIGLVSSLQARNRGDVVDTPKAPNVKLPLAPKAVNGAMLSDLLVRWEKERQPSTKARQEWGVVVRRFAEQHGDLAVDMIQRQHVVAFEDKMVDNGASPATIRKHLGALGSLLQLAVDNGLCSANVGRGVRVRGSKVAAEARLPYETEDLKRIFASPIYTDSSYRPTACAGETAYWLPLLGLFTGARLEELGQARVDDVREADGIRFLDISDAGRGRA